MPEQLSLIEHNGNEVWLTRLVFPNASFITALESKKQQCRGHRPYVKNGQVVFQSVGPFDVKQVKTQAQTSSINEVVMECNKDQLFPKNKQEGGLKTLTEADQLWEIYPRTILNRLRTPSSKYPHFNRALHIILNS